MKERKLTSLQRELLVFLEQLGDMVFIPLSFWRGTLGLTSPVSTYRSAIHRLSKEGVIRRVHSAGGAVFRLTDKGKDLLARIPRLSDVYRKWDGKWRLVSFDFPERAHKDRDHLRRKLKELGFGRLHRSVWVSPHDQLGKVRDIIDTHGYHDMVWDFEGNLTGGRIPRELVSSVWPQLKDLNRKYQEFASRWTNRMAKVSTEVPSRGKEFDILKKSVHRAAEYELAEIVAKDPCLPRHLLPDGWAMDKAFQVLRRIGR